MTGHTTEELAAVERNMAACHDDIRALVDVVRLVDVAGPDRFAAVITLASSVVADNASTIASEDLAGNDLTDSDAEVGCAVALLAGALIQLADGPAGGAS